MLVLRLLVSIVPVAETTKLLSSEVLRQLWLYRKSKQILEALLSKSAAGCNHDDILVCTLKGNTIRNYEIHKKYYLSS
jgi:hypothetical protein